MLEFNNNHIFTGYLKQLLASFNLPTYRIYTKEQEEYFKETGKEKNIIGTLLMSKKAVLDIGTDNTFNDYYYKYNNHIRYAPYLKHDIVQDYIIETDVYGVPTDEGVWVAHGTALKNRESKLTSHLHHYEYNSYIPNYTKHLQIKNNIYDSYTHEYLGDFLRFQRDYLGIDLMPLYNCFSNKLCSKCNISIFENSLSGETGATSIGIKNIITTFDSEDTRYKIYCLPVKLFKNYTIAIDSNASVELCCAVYGKYQDTRDKFAKIPTLTYQKIGYMNFGQPILYTKLATLFEELSKQNPEAPKIVNDTELELAQNEVDLKLFIKLPFNNASSITILEGDYLNWNDRLFDVSRIAGTAINKFNHVITNFEGVVKANKHIGITEDQTFKLITPLQLLKLNTGVSYPFADRLIEYLSGNVITNEDYLADDITRLQTVLGMSGTDNYPIFTSQFVGTWENKYRPILYDYINNEKNIYTWNSDVNHDILGFVDKDIEKLYTRKDTDGVAHTISNINIYQDIYRDDD